MRFSKWHALGNSYLLVERADLDRELTPAVVRALCDGARGVGADGVLEIVSAEEDRAELRVWNPDGSQAEFSGNGARIAARWLARRAGVTRVRLRLPAGEIAGEVDGGEVTVDLGIVEVGETETLTLGSETVDVTPVSVGNPHAVVRGEPTSAEIRRLGPLLERHARFPERTNVQLVRVDGEHELTVAVWERGAGETQSSGSSAVSAAAAAVARGWCASPVRVTLPGGQLRVELGGDGGARLTGPATEIFRGELVGAG